MDIGALDTFDKLGNGQIDFVFLTEDSNSQFLKKLVASAGFQLDRVLFFSYKTSSALNSAYLLVNFIREIANNSQVIIHRDRDFMTDTEVAYVEQKISSQGATPFITSGSDIESYFCCPEHLQEKLEVAIGDIHSWIADLAIEMQVETQHSFTTKRMEIRSLLYRTGQIEVDPPETLTLLGPLPFSASKMVGKRLLKKIRGTMQQRFGKTVDVCAPSENLDTHRLQAIRLGND